MNRIYTMIAAIVAVLAASSCGNGKNKSDAFGNFETVETMVGAEAQGKIIKFDVEEGNPLKKGQLVGIIDTTSLWLKKQQLVAMKKASEAKLTQIRSQIEVQETQKQTLLKEKNRIQNLLKDKAIPEKQLDDIDGQLNMVNSQILSIKSQNLSVSAEMESINAQIKQVDDQLAKSYILNPIDGVVLEKYVEPFEVVTMSKNLYKIANLSTMQLKVYVSGSQLPHIKIGQKIEVRIDADAKANQTLEGIVSWISSQAEFTPKIIQTKEERVKQVYAVKVDVKNDGRIKIGMPGEVKFMLSEK